MPSDLDPLFSDLPGPRPGQAVATTPGLPGAALAEPPARHRPGAADAARRRRSDTGNRSSPGLTAVMWPRDVILLLTFVIPAGGTSGG